VVIAKFNYASWFEAGRRPASNRTRQRNGIWLQRKNNLTTGRIAASHELWKPSLVVASTTSAIFTSCGLWTLSYDPDLRIWPRKCQDEPARQTSMSKITYLESH